MEFEEVVRRRRMVRNYDPTKQPDPVVIERLIKLATRAPSAGFSQGWHFLVLDDTTSCDEFWAATTDANTPADAWLGGMRTAPVLILALSEPGVYLRRYAEADKGWDERDQNRWPVPYWDVDTGMASMLILLGIVDSGLAGCFFGVPVERIPGVTAAFGIPKTMNFVGVISVGYPKADRPPASPKRGRRPVDEVLSFRKFGQTQRFT